MAGILLYPSARRRRYARRPRHLGKPGELGPVLCRALARAGLCNSDPLCANHQLSAAANALHGAACHACLLVAETSCERGNRYLDRSVLFDTLHHRGLLPRTPMTVPPDFAVASGGYVAAMKQPQVAIVTGAAHGIGLATARRLTGRGMSVAAVDVDGDVLAGAELPEGVRRVVADVADDPALWLAEVDEELGTPTVLVNNAARMDGRSFLELPVDEVRRSFDVTLFGTWALTRQVVDRMIERGLAGSVVFTLSLHSHRVRMCPDYSAAKAGLAMLVQELANELGPYGIRVNSVSPGAIDTWSDQVTDGEGHVARSEALVPMGRLGTPEDVARAIEFLADSAAGPYITGADLKVDGGLDQFNWIHHLYGSAEEERNRRS